MATFNQVKDKNPNIETYLSKVSYAESRNNPNAKNPYGSATGLFQFVSGTWKNLTQKYGLNYSLEDRKNPEKAAHVMRLFTEENERQIRPVVGRELNDGDRYLAHFLGAGGANKFFRTYNSNPNAPISTVMSQNALDSNKNVVYNKDGSLKTVGDVYNWAAKKMDTKVKPQIYADTFTPQAKSEKETFPEIAKYSAPLDTSTAEYNEPEEEPVAVQEAKQDIAQKSFVQEYSKLFESQQQQVEEQRPTQVQEEYFSPDMPDPYNYIASEPVMEEFQTGGAVRDNIPTIKKEILPRYLEETPKEFMLNYIDSPKYRERLQNQGYKNVNNEINQRRQRVEDVKFEYQNGKPTVFGQLKNKITNRPYSTLGSQYEPSTNTIISDNKTDRVAVGDPKLNEKSVIVHEIGHAELNNTSNNHRLNDNDYYELIRRQKNFSEETESDLRNLVKMPENKLNHDLKPTENKSDINSLRYELKKANIYDAGTQEFKKEHLDKLKDSFIKKRLLKSYRDEDLIWLMNNVAMNEDSSEIRFAQEGAIIDSRGQWAHPGEVTIIPGNDITMQGVDYPVLGIDNLGNEQMMYPGQDYQFEGDYVTEYPQIKNRKTNRFL